MLFVFITLGSQASAAIPDSLKDDYSHFLKVLKEKVTIYHLQEHIYKFRRMIGKAVVMYGKEIAIHSVLKDTMGVMHDYHWMAWMFYEHKLYEECLIAHNKTIDIVNGMPMTESNAEKKWTHGFFYSVAGWELKKPEYQDSAEKYLEEAFYHCLDVRGEVHMEWVITYAMSLARNKKTTKAVEIAKYGLGIAEKYDDVLYLARFTKQLSHYYMFLEKEDSSYFYIYESARYEEQMYEEGDPSIINLGEANGSLSLYNIGFFIDINNHFGHVEKSLAILDRLISGPNKIQDSELLNYYRKMAAQTQRLNGDFEGALVNYELFVSYNDSIWRAKSDKAREVKTAQLEATISIEKERAAEEKRRLDELAEKEKENLRTIIYSVTILGVIVIVFLIFVYRRFKITTKQNRIIEKQKEQVEVAYQKLDVQNTEILDSINYAKRIQSAILPSEKKVTELLPDSFILYLPKALVAGDFYWLEQIKNKTLFAAADCTGHGVPGAMVSVICNNGLNRSVREKGLTIPGEILDFTRQVVIEEFEKSDEEVNDGMDIALCSIDNDLSPNGGHLVQYAGANNPLWVIRKGANEIETYKANRLPIGKYLHNDLYKTHSLEVFEGDMMYVFSDGFSDQFGGERGKKYYAANFQKFLLTIKDLPLTNQKQALLDEFNRWKGDHDQIDDVCVIGLRI